jgi:hypothetical protein
MHRLEVQFGQEEAPTNESVVIVSPGILGLRPVASLMEFPPTFDMSEAWRQYGESGGRLSFHRGVPGTLDHRTLMFDQWLVHNYTEEEVRILEVKALKNREDLTDFYAQVGLLDFSQAPLPEHLSSKGLPN